MRIQRIRSDAHTDRLDSFYKILTNAQAAGRGIEVLLIKRNTFAEIAETVQKLQTYASNHRGYGCDLSQVLFRIYCDGYYSKSYIKLSNKILPGYLTRAVEILECDVKGRKVTLNTLSTSGKILEIANIVGFDPEYECMRYGIPVI